MVQINWSNGGWLDSSHFDPPEVDSDGSCSFTTFDGKDYDLQIEGSGACSYSSSSPIDDEEEEMETEESNEIEEEVYEESIIQNEIQRDQLFAWIQKTFWRLKK